MGEASGFEVGSVSVTGCDGGGGGGGDMTTEWNAQVPPAGTFKGEDVSKTSEGKPIGGGGGSRGVCRSRDEQVRREEDQEGGGDELKSQVGSRKANWEVGQPQVKERRIATRRVASTSRLSKPSAAEMRADVEARSWKLQRSTHGGMYDVRCLYVGM